MKAITADLALRWDSAGGVGGKSPVSSSIVLAHWSSVWLRGVGYFTLTSHPYYVYTLLPPFDAREGLIYLELCCCVPSRAQPEVLGYCTVDIWFTKWSVCGRARKPAYLGRDGLFSHGCDTLELSPGVS